MSISLAGWVLGRAMHIDVRSIGRVSFYFFNPVLVFSILVDNHLSVREMISTGLLCLFVTIGSGLLTLVGSKLLKFDKKTTISSLLTSMFANNGNYGLPLIAFAFGADALSYASLYFVFSALITNTVGILIASMGKMTLKEAIVGVMRIPTVYAVVLALMINQSGISIPLPIGRTIEILKGAGVPLMILLLGLELSKVKWTSSIGALGLSTAVRLLAGPLMGLGFASALGLQGIGLKAGVVDASMSAAVVNANLATEFELDSSLVAATILVSTLLSPIILTPLILYLGAS